MNFMKSDILQKAVQKSNGWTHLAVRFRLDAGPVLLRELPELVAAAELCEDLWAPNPPSVGHALAGATVLVNLSASDEATGKGIS